jgi:hypothetical protein
MLAMQAYTVEQPAAPVSRAPRTVTTLLVARLLRPGCPDTPCRIRNVSTTGLMMETHAELTPDMPVSIELRDGTRLDGSVAWYKDGRAGIAASTTIDLDRFLGGPTKEHGAPRAPRFNIDCPVRLSSYGRSTTGTIENLSQTGARVVLATPAAPGAACLVNIPGLPPRHCEIRWCDGEEAGVRFVEPIAFAELARWLDSSASTN